jgi:hypothetical protein
VTSPATEKNQLAIIEFSRDFNARFKYAGCSCGRLKSHLSLNHLRCQQQQQQRLMVDNLVT